MCVTFIYLKTNCDAEQMLMASSVLSAESILSLIYTSELYVCWAIAVTVTED